MGFEEKEKLRAKKRSVVSTIAGIGADEQIDGQENIETLEDGKYLPSHPAKQEQATKRGRPKEEREIKKRISLAIFPSIYEDIKKIAYVDRESISEVISNCLEEYIEQNQAKLKEYDRLTK
jgi:hypothetical protein